MYLPIFILSFVGFLHAELTHIDGQNTDVKIITNFYGGKNSNIVNLILILFYEFDFEEQIKTIDPKILSEAYIDVYNKKIFETFCKHFKSKLNINQFFYEVSEIDAYDKYSAMLQEKKERVRNNLQIRDDDILFRMIEMSVILENISIALALRARSNENNFCALIYLGHFFDMLAIFFMLNNEDEQYIFFIRLVQLYLAAKCVQINNYPNASKYIFLFDFFYLYHGKYLEKVRSNSNHNLFVIWWDEKLFELDIYKFGEINENYSKYDLKTNSEHRKNVVNEFIDVDTYDNGEIFIFETDKSIINRIESLLKLIDDQKDICYAPKNEQELVDDELHDKMLLKSNESTLIYSKIN
ncbi:hypothetical protein COBT_002100 [Conglomerata obtusa]